MAQRLGKSLYSTKVKAYRYRAKGIPLRNMREGARAGFRHEKAPLNFKALPQGIQDAATEVAYQLLLRDAKTIGEAYGAFKGKELWPEDDRSC